MTLVDYCDDTLTDKNTRHSYIEVYEKLLCEKKESATHILEVGIGDWQPNAGSAKMWASYFNNAQVHIVDIINIDKVNPDVYSHPRIHLHMSNDAYNVNFFTNTFLSKEMRFDMLLDDGPHTLESMISFVQMYSKIMKDDGILMVEDVQDIEWIKTLEACTPDELRPYIEIYDLRNIKGRYDDIVFVINKSKPTIKHVSKTYIL